MARDDRPPWTDDEREAVKQMLRLDYTCSGIGRIFHPPMTRNAAVVGRIILDPELRMCRPAALAWSLRNQLRRLVSDRQEKLDAKKLADATAVAATAATSVIEPLKERKARMPDPMLIQRKIAAAGEVIENPLPPPRVVPVHGMRMVALEKLERGECRWPVEERPKVTGHYLFCGKATKPGVSYCEAHAFAAQPSLRIVRQEVRRGKAV